MHGQGVYVDRKNERIDGRWINGRPEKLRRLNFLIGRAWQMQVVPTATWGDNFPRQNIQNKIKKIVDNAINS